MILSQVFKICDEIYSDSHSPVTEISCGYRVYDDLWKECQGEKRSVRSPFSLTIPQGKVLVTVNPYIDRYEYSALFMSSGCALYRTLESGVGKVEERRKKCDCPIHVVFNFGCKCGGV